MSIRDGVGGVAAERSCLVSLASLSHQAGAGSLAGIAVAVEAGCWWTGGTRLGGRTLWLERGTGQAEDLTTMELLVLWSFILKVQNMIYVVLIAV